MAVAPDARSTSTLTNDPSWTHTPVGTPRGVVVGIAAPSGSDIISGVTYGGVAMGRVAVAAKAAAEAGSVYVYFLGTGIPTGAQTVTVTTSGVNTAIGHATTLTAAADTEVVDSDNTINSDSIANPSVTLSLGGRTSYCYIRFLSGQDAVGGITPFTGWTSRAENDAGTFTIGVYDYDTIGSTDVSAGWTQAADDAIAVAVAVSERRSALLHALMNH
jgi:hypothetical protein